MYLLTHETCQQQESYLHYMGFRPFLQGVGRKFV
nr:MAG TPA: hypothetical protein [Caudoviricetes sp.]